MTKPQFIKTMLLANSFMLVAAVFVVLGGLYLLDNFSGNISNSANSAKTREDSRVLGQVDVPDQIDIPKLRLLSGRGDRVEVIDYQGYNNYTVLHSFNRANTILPIYTQAIQYGPRDNVAYIERELNTDSVNYVTGLAEVVNLYRTERRIVGIVSLDSKVHALVRGNTFNDDYYRLFELTGQGDATEIARFTATTNIYPFVEEEVMFRDLAGVCYRYAGFDGGGDEADDLDTDNDQGDDTDNDQGDDIDADSLKEISCPDAPVPKSSLQGYRIEDVYQAPQQLPISYPDDDLDLKITRSSLVRDNQEETEFVYRSPRNHKLELLTVGENIHEDSRVLLLESDTQSRYKKLVVLYPGNDDRRSESYSLPLVDRVSYIKSTEEVDLFELRDRGSGRTEIYYLRGTTIAPLQTPNCNLGQICDLYILN